MAGKTALEEQPTTPFRKGSLTGLAAEDIPAVALIVLVQDNLAAALGLVVGAVCKGKDPLAQGRERLRIGSGFLGLYRELDRFRKAARNLPPERNLWGDIPIRVRENVSVLERSHSDLLDIAHSCFHFGGRPQSGSL
jgi:hypothetical protein